MKHWSQDASRLIQFRVIYAQILSGKPSCGNAEHEDSPFC